MIVCFVACSWDIFLFCLIMNIHIYNLFYICTGTHACMGFVPDNKLIRIRIRIRWKMWCIMGDISFAVSFSTFA